MIGFLRGNILLKQGNNLILEVSGIGYELSVPVSVSETLQEGEQAALFVHYAVRDDGHYLYGFLDLAQRAWFRELIRINGIGAKLALLILSAFSGGQLRQIITEKDSAALIKLPGIGKKTAERILLDLQDRLEKLPVFADDETIPLTSARHDAEEALMALGYKQAEVTALLDKIPTENADADMLIRQALRLKFQG